MQSPLFAPAERLQRQAERELEKLAEAGLLQDHSFMIRRIMCEHS